MTIWFWTGPVEKLGSVTIREVPRPEKRQKDIQVLSFPHIRQNRLPWYTSGFK